MVTRTLRIILRPKLYGSGYGFLKTVGPGTCEIGSTIAELKITSVTPETSIEPLLKWLKEAPDMVNKFTPYTLNITEVK